MFEKMLNKMKENKKQLILPGIVTLLPILAGLILWNKLPDPMPIHFNVHNEADGWAARWVAVVVLPVLVLFIHVLCVMLDKYNVNKKQKFYGIVYWICPFISLLCTTMMYTFALGYTWDLSRIMLPVLGILLMVTGNYMPKILPNKTLGIKLPWTFKSESNWHATHRFAGKVWVLCGLVMLFCMLLEKNMLLWVFFPVLIVAMGAPTLYSYLYDRKHGDQ